MTSAEKLVGTWRLVEWTVSVNGSVRRHPYGGDASGLLMYTADGHMSASLMRPDRPDLPTRTLSSAPEDLRARAASGYVAYAGSYFVDGGHVVHRVELSLLPNWVGSLQRRQMDWVDNDLGTEDLVLTTPPEEAETGSVIINMLRWRKSGEHPSAQGER